jgi:hypothetical protein
MTCFRYDLVVRASLCLGALCFVSPTLAYGQEVSPVPTSPPPAASAQAGPSESLSVVDYVFLGMAGARTALLACGVEKACGSTVALVGTIGLEAGDIVGTSAISAFSGRRQLVYALGVGRFSYGASDQRSYLSSSYVVHGFEYRVEYARYFGTMFRFAAGGMRENSANAVYDTRSTLQWGTGFDVHAPVVLGPKIVLVPRLGVELGYQEVSVSGPAPAGGWEGVGQSMGGLYWGGSAGGALRLYNVLVVGAEAAVTTARLDQTSDRLWSVEGRLHLGVMY